MQFHRIQQVIDISTIQQKSVTIVGAGGSAPLIENLTRCGVRHWKLIDFDHIEPVNISRQGHSPEHIGLPKVEALSQRIQIINPEATVECFPVDFTSLSETEIQQSFAETDLFIFATDNFAAQARGNEVALMLNVPALWIGLYQGGLGGEVVFWHPDLDCCFRCLCSHRYKAQARAKANGLTLDPPSEGATIFDIQLLDAIAGHLALGLLTRCCDNRFGRLIDQLGTRQFIQVGISPDFRIRKREIIREQLGISAECDSFFAWNSIALRDPAGGADYCLDCEKYRDVIFTPSDARSPAKRIERYHNTQS